MFICIFHELKTVKIRAYGLSFWPPQQSYQAVLHWCFLSATVKAGELGQRNRTARGTYMLNIEQDSVPTRNFFTRNLTKLFSLSVESILQVCFLGSAQQQIIFQSNKHFCFFISLFLTCLTCKTCSSNMLGWVANKKYQ